MTEPHPLPETAEKISPAPKWLKWTLIAAFKVILPVLIVLSALGFYKRQMDTRPQAQRRAAERQARLVTAEQVRSQTRAAVVSAMGTVKAATTVSLTPEVSGLVTFIDPMVVPGGQVKAGQVLYRIDSRDYEAIVQQRQSDVARAELAMRLEMGNQMVARQEYELLGELIDERDRELVLRKPQLQQAQEALAAAAAALAKARLDVERCVICAPFNAVITAKHADLGARVSPTAPLAVLTGTDNYWIEALVPMGQLQWIAFPDAEHPHGSAVQIHPPSAWRQGQFRQGVVLRLMGQLEEAGRLAQVLISVPDPLNLYSNGHLPPLLIGSYVRVEIESAAIPDVVVLPREYLRDGSSVWVINPQNALEIRRPKIIFRGRDAVYISQGLADGEYVVTSDLTAPAEGIPLRVDGRDRNPEKQP